MQLLVRCECVDGCGKHIWSCSPISSSNNSSVADGDYEAVVDEQFVFRHGDTHMCHNVTISNDDVCESDTNENFFSDLLLISGAQPINITRPTAEVIIVDVDEPECGMW